MREILYRGKRLDNGEWVFGGIRIVQGRYYIIPEESNPFGFEVGPDTVGQYTGLQDKNDNKIFEGDILSVLVFQANGEDIPGEIVIKWDEERASYVGADIKDAEEWWGVHWLLKPIIIGNRWDNPDLLKGGEK